MSHADDEPAPAPVRVVAGLLQRDGRVLLCHRTPARKHYPDVWDLPGGHVDEGEDSAQALVREMAEELGITVPTPGGSPWRTLHAGDILMDVYLVDDWQGANRSTPIPPSTTRSDGSGPTRSRI